MLAYPKLQAVIGDADEIVELVALAAIVVNPHRDGRIAREPDDDRLIEAAQTSRSLSSWPATRTC